MRKLRSWAQLVMWSLGQRLEPREFQALTARLKKAPQMPSRRLAELQRAGVQLVRKVLRRVPGSVAAFREWEHQLSQAAADISKETAALRQQDWREYLSASVQGHAKQGHHLTRLHGLDPRFFSASGHKDIWESMAEEQDKWCQLWQRDEDWTPPPVPCGLGYSIGQVRAACLSFSVHTCSVDGLHPRAIALLSDGMIDGLGKLCRGVEMTGQWPGPWNGLLVKQIPKPSGGFRPILLFRSLIRVYGKLGLAEVRQWEQRMADSGVFNHSPKRKILDGAYRQMVRQAGDPKAWGVALFFDITKAFEQVGYARLWAFAQAHHYPLLALRNAILTYRHKRRLMYQGNVVGPWTLARNGIGAGSSTAVAELKLFMVDFLVHLQRQHLSVRVSVHVDDLCVAGMGHQADPIAATTGIVHDIRQGMAKLQLPSAQAKEGTIATSWELTRAVHRIMGRDEHGIRARAEHGVPGLLGIDYAYRLLKQARRPALQAGRILKYQLRSKKAKAIYKAMPYSRVMQAGMLKGCS